MRLGYLSQEVAELPGDLRLIEAVTQIAGVVELGGKMLTAGQLAERFGFTNDPPVDEGRRSCPAASAAGCSCCAS